MDLVYRIIPRRLILVVALVCLCAFSTGSFATVAPSLSNAGSQANAKTYCAEENGPGYYPSPQYTATLPCTYAVAPNGDPSYHIMLSLTSSGNPAADIYFYWVGALLTANPCTNLQGRSVDYVVVPGGGALGHAGATWETDQTTGAQVQCPFNITYGQQSAIADQYGHFHIPATIAYTGNPSGSENTTSAAGSDSFLDGTGNTASPQPTASAGATPQLCGGGSCIQNGQACGVLGGSQVCVPLPATSAQNSCGSSASGSLCAGTPTAPSPGAGSPIVDPSTQIASSDKYSQLNPSTGAVTPVVVNTYVAPGATSSSGASSGSAKASNSSGSSAPASSSTSANSGSFSGGGDCNSPPVCSGDAATCGIARETWTSMCTAKASADSLQKVFVGDGTQTPTLAPLHAASDLDGQTVDLGDTSGADSSGMGWSTTCPLQDVTITVVGVSVPLTFKPVCDYGAWMRAFVMLLASIGYAGIMGGFKVGSIFGGGGGSD